MAQDVRFRFRRGTTSEWTLRDPILGPGEPGLEIETNRMKIGDGATPWSLLPYFEAEPVGSGGETPVDLEAHVNDPTPHAVYDSGPSLLLLYQNAKV